MLEHTAVDHYSSTQPWTITLAHTPLPHYSSTHRLRPSLAHTHALPLNLPRAGAEHHYKPGIPKLDQQHTDGTQKSPVMELVITLPAAPRQ